MKKTILLVILITINATINTINAFSQSENSELWHTFLKRKSTEYAIYAKSNYFALSDNALYSVSKQNTQNYKLWDRQNGLSQALISNMEYSKDNNTLIIFYKSGIIDLLTEDGIDHINDIALSENISNKTIDRIYDFGYDGCFLSGDIGVVDIDIAKKIINGTYFSSQKINSLAYMKKYNLIAVIKDETFIIGDRNKNLQDPYNWKSIEQGDKKAKNVATIGNYFVVLFDDGSFKYFDNNGKESTPILKNEIFPTSIDKIVDYPFGFVAFNKNNVYVVNDDLSIKTKTIEGNVWVSQDGNIMTQSIGDRGFKVYDLANPNKDKQINIQFNSPSSNNFYFTRVQDSKLMSVNGGRYFDRFNHSGEVNVFDGKNWKSVNGYTLDNKINNKFKDPVDIIMYNNGQKYFYVSTWGEGIVKLDENLNFVEHYDDKNTALLSAIPGSSNFIRVSSLSIDDKNNLWMTMGSSPKPIASMSKDGKWKNYDVSKIKDTNAFGQMICLPNGIKYILDFFLTNKGEGFTIIKTNDLDYTDGNNYAQHFSKVREFNGKTVDFSIINCMALDKKGSMWFGSDIGFFIINQPTKLPQYGTLPIVSRPVGGDEPPYYRILDNVNIKAIAVDNLNNKWMGTENDGIYLLSEDGSEVIKHYDMSNSPLVSNSISSLSFDDKNGVMYIGTASGLNSISLSAYKYGDKELSKITVFPNPLKPQDRDLITITGLSQGMILSIFDSSGQLVHKGVSLSSEYEWIPRNLNNNRLPSGIYTIVIYSDKLSRTKTIKVGIVR